MFAPLCSWAPSSPKKHDPVIKPFSSTGSFQPASQKYFPSLPSSSQLLTILDAVPDITTAPGRRTIIHIVAVLLRAADSLASPEKGNPESGAERSRPLLFVSRSRKLFDPYQFT